jgi:hypothetical protein
MTRWYACALGDPARHLKVCAKEVISLRLLMNEQKSLVGGVKFAVYTLLRLWRQRENRLMRSPCSVSLSVYPL